jgi:hypothetical protein
VNRWNSLSRSSQLLLGAGTLLFVFLFFDWQERGGYGRSGWHGWGVAVGLFTIALVVWELAQVVNTSVDLPFRTTLLTVVLAGCVLLFTVIKFFVDNEFRHWPAWVGLILAILIAVGGWLRWQGDAPKEMRAA